MMEGKAVLDTVGTLGNCCIAIPLKMSIRHLLSEVQIYLFPLWHDVILCYIECKSEASQSYLQMPLALFIGVN